MGACDARFTLAWMALSISSSIAAIEDEIDKAIQASVKRASQAPIPTPDRLHAGVFHEKA